ncbi:MAG: hypothetical protein ACRDU9_09220 [Acidimicrobiia bacterium]
MEVDTDGDLLNLAQEHQEGKDPNEPTAMVTAIPTDWSCSGPEILLIRCALLFEDTPLSPDLVKDRGMLTDNRNLKD